MQLRVERRTFLFLLTPFLNSARVLLHPTRNLWSLPNYWLRRGLVFLAFQPKSIVIRDGLLIMRLFLIFIKCMVFASLQLHHIIPMVTLYANGSTILCLALWGLLLKSRNQIGQFICHLWSMLIIPFHMHQQVSSHTNLCSGAKHQCHVMIGWDWHIINQIVSSLRLSGWTNNSVQWCIPINKPQAHK